MKKFWKKFKKGLKGVGRTLSGAGSQVANVLKDAAHRVVSVVDAAGGAIGIMPMKKLRVRVVILRDQNGLLAQPPEVQPLLDELIRIYHGAKIKVIAAGSHYVSTRSEVAPQRALDVSCGRGAWTADFGEAGAYYRRVEASNLAGTLTGYAAPVTGFIVRSMSGHEGGCSLTFLADYVTVAKTELPTRPAKTLAHEVGHACGLPHVGAANNLMNPDTSGEHLSHAQKVIIRTSRHVTYL